MQENLKKSDAATDKDILLKMVDIEKTFPGVKALDHAQLTVKRGTVHALMGENGAGKSTLMKCLFGVYSKDNGHIYVEGKEVNYKNSKEALENGVAMVHQELNQALKRNVMDNMWLGRFPKVSKFLPFTSEKKMYDETMKVFEDLDINVDPKTVMSTMSVSQRQMVEIAKAVSYNSKIIVFDEPTSSLTEEEVEHLFRIINMLRDRGCGIIYISHKMEEILRISDEVTIMRDGKWIATKPASELTMDEIIKLMVGRELTNRYPEKDNKIGDVLLKVENLSGEYTNLSNVSFEAKKGEILGVAGVAGSGQKELCETIAGLMKVKKGAILYKKENIIGKSPEEIIKIGISMSFIPEDRLGMGLVASMGMADNLLLKRYKEGKTPFVEKKEARRLSKKLIEKLNIKTPGIDTPVRQLSGGNVQKVLLGREIESSPNVLITAYAVRGLDINSSYTVYDNLNEQKKKGTGILYIGEDLDVMLELCDRIMVLCHGKVTGIVDAKDVTKEQIGLLMTDAFGKEEDSDEQD